jgi:hypothetical protein
VLSRVCWIVSVIVDRFFVAHVGWFHILCCGSNKHPRNHTVLVVFSTLGITGDSLPPQLPLLSESSFTTSSWFFSSALFRSTLSTPIIRLINLIRAYSHQRSHLPCFRDMLSFIAGCEVRISMKPATHLFSSFSYAPKFRIGSHGHQ